MRLRCVVFVYVLIKNVSLSNGTSQTQNQTTLEMHNNDWSQVNSSNAYFGPVTDERWEKFDSPKRKTVRLNESISFSIKVKGNYSFTIISENPIDYKYFTLIRNKINLKEENVSEISWFHCTFTKENNGVALRSCKNDEKIATTFEPFRIGFDVATDVKIHDYDFYEANWTTVQNNKSYVDIPFVDDPLCLSTFVSVDKGCYLNLTLKLVNETQIFNVSGFNEDNHLKTWKKININVPSKGILYFERGRQDDMENGYWAIDDIKSMKCNSTIVESVYRNSNESATKTITDYTTPELTTPHTFHFQTNDFYNSTSIGNESRNWTTPFNLSIHLSAKPNGIGLTFNSTSFDNFIINVENNVTFENRTSEFQNSLMFPVEQGEYYVKGVEEHYPNVCDTFKNGEIKTNWIIKENNSHRGKLRFTANNSSKDVVYIGNKTFLLVFVFNKTHNLNIYSVLCTTSNDNVVLIIGGTLLLLVFVVLLFIFICKYRNILIFHSRTTTQQEQILLSPVGMENSANVDMNDFDTYLKNMLRTGTLVEQFNSLPENYNKRAIIGLQYENIKKNKYDYYVPYDSNRIILEKLKGVEGGDYYNASYIDGCERSKAYIACQGPKYNTVSDLWRMIWQEDVNAIVMATNFMEDDQRMCAEYFPQRLNTVIEYGAITIKLIKQHVFEHYEKRLLEVHYSRFRRVIQHFHLNWNFESDRFYPINALPVVKEIRKICKESTVPVVIHSGFGIDRTAVLILCDLALEMVQKDNNVNFLKITKKMREQRPYMLKMKEHYILAHLIVLEFIMEKENPFNNSAKISVSSDTILGQQLSFLERLCWHDKIVHKRKTFGDERLTSGLHPVFVDGYGRSNKYIALKSPTKNNVPCFWWIVVNQRICNILFLDEMKENDKRVLYSYRGTINGTVLRIAAIESSELINVGRTKIKILAYEQNTKEVTYDDEIDIIYLRNWTPENCEASITTILRTAISFNNETKQPPILVACRDRASSGIFIALSYILEKYAFELEIDICCSLRILRRSSDDFVKKIKHLNFIYLTVLEYLEHFQSYQRIEEL